MKDSSVEDTDIKGGSHIWREKWGSECCGMWNQTKKKFEQLLGSEETRCEESHKHREAPGKTKLWAEL